MALNLKRYTVQINGIDHEFQFESDDEAKARYPHAKRVSGAKGNVDESKPVGDVVPHEDDEAKAKARTAENKSRTADANKGANTRTQTSPTGS